MHLRRPATFKISHCITGCIVVRYSFIVASYKLYHVGHRHDDPQEFMLPIRNMKKKNPFVCKGVSFAGLGGLCGFSTAKFQISN